MKRILLFVHQNLRWIFLGIMYMLICFALYQDLKNILPWQYILLTHVLGLALGLTVIVKIIDPFFKRSDAKVFSWFGIKNPRV